MEALKYVKKEPYQLFIDGKYIPSENGSIVDVINPANNLPFAKAY